MQVRRAVAIGALIVVILLVALGVHSCQVNATNSALQNYTNSVSSLVARSDLTGRQLFAELQDASAANDPTGVQNEINKTLGDAEQQLSNARNQSVPDQVRTGNGHFVLALRMRADGIAGIANEIQPALATSTTRGAVDALAIQMARFYASDVVYKEYAAAEIAEAVNGAGVRFSPLNAGQFLPSLQWLSPTFIASELHVSAQGLGPAKIAPGLHGHQLNSVSVAGTALSTTSTNTIPVSPAPTFTLNFANTGTNNETNVGCKVSVSGTQISGQTTVAQTVAGQNATCQVTLRSTPPSGSQTVVATIEPVPGEKNLTNNTLSFPVSFQ